MEQLILSMPYTFGLTWISFYGTRELDIIVINTSTTITNILMQYESSETLIIKYLINAPLASKLICPKLYLAMVPLVLPHNYIKDS